MYAQVLERYYGRRRDGGDLDVTYRVRLAGDDVLVDDGAPTVKPATRQSIEQRLRAKGADDVQLHVTRGA